MTNMKTLPISYYLAFIAGSFLLSLVLTPLVKRLALATGQVAVPRDSRWHKKETPLMGGVSIFVSYMIVWVLGGILMGFPLFSLPFLPMLLCATGIFCLGLADDIFNMDPQHKLAGQIVIISVLVFFGLRLEWTDSNTINLFLSIIWIVGITNAFNLLDNMDGLSAGIAFIACLFFFLIHYMSPQISPLAGPILFMSAIYLGVILGFLIYNFNPASIFMGDAGSLFIGFVLGCMTAISNPARPVGGTTGYLLSVIAIPILIVFIPILDTGFVSVMRKLFNRSISQGGRDHSSHRMVAIGFSEKKAVLVLYAFAVTSGLIALAIGRLGIGSSLVVIILYFLLVLFFWIHLGKVKVYPEESILTQADRGGVTPILIEITYRRRLFEVLLDLVLITIAYYTAYLLRFEGALGGNFDFFLKSLPIMIASQIFWFYVIGIYRGVWESTGLRDLTDYVKAITGGTVMAMLILLFVYRFYSFSRAVFFIYWVLMLLLLSLSRLSFRLLEEGITKRNQGGRPTLIYGAGIGGQMAMREIETNRDLGLTLVGFIDDNPRKQRSKIMGYPVFGGQEGLDRVITKHNIQEIIVSFKQHGEERRKEVKNLCRKLGVEVEVKQMRLVIG
jgi:UDP-GlcNAc:undecaprenyl-phosphate GlcNAc-1-phosphate transferase